MPGPPLDSIQNANIQVNPWTLFFFIYFISILFSKTKNIKAKKLNLVAWFLNRKLSFLNPCSQHCN